MPRIVTLTADPSPLAVNAVSSFGLLGLGASAVLHGLIASPLQPTQAVLVPGLLLCALTLIMAGLVEWRRQQLFPAVVFTAFGLFACAQLPELLHPAAGPAGYTSPMAAAGFLTLWGLFALLLCGNAGSGNRLLQICLAALGVSLLFKVAALSTGLATPTFLAVAAGLVAGGTALLTTAQLCTRTSRD